MLPNTDAEIIAYNCGAQLACIDHAMGYALAGTGSIHALAVTPKERAAHQLLGAELFSEWAQRGYDAQIGEFVAP